MELTTTLTPVEDRAGRWYKREDHHRLGPVNGAKLRACQALIGSMAERGVRNVVTAASVLSPQHAIVASVAADHGLASHHVVGATNDRAMARHPSVRAALAVGARFHHVGCAYNASLQPEAERLARAMPAAEVLHYGITTGPRTPLRDVRAFAEVGGHQVANLPASVRRLVIPFGSGNSACGIFTGLDMYDRRDVEVVLVGIGPPRAPWLFDRLDSIGVRTADVIELHDLHGTGWARYADKMPETRDGITFHPTYEGKVVRYLDQCAPRWWTTRDASTCMWIIGAPVTHPTDSGKVKP